MCATAAKGEVRIWQLSTLKELLRMTVPGADCRAVAFSADGRSCLSGWSDGKIRAWGPQSGKVGVWGRSGRSESGGLAGGWSRVGGVEGRRGRGGCSSVAGIICGCRPAACSANLKQNLG